ncbi:MAG: type II toxin-antitoxin system RelE/ParE family toxin [Polaribacter sp.]|uniref:type II toxin-antitoxin system RelE/ParE family toxin n=1 Tax=Polaribacter sp. TaxID=1920175 RepID=UPI003267A333
MKREVIITKTAQKKLNTLFNYLIENWSSKVKSDFINKLDKNIDLIKQHPESFLSSKKRIGLHKCVITKQVTLFYRFNAKNIIVTTIFDTRQNPDKLNKDL